MLIFYEIVKWIQIASTALFLFLFLGKTFYLRRKEKLNTIMLRTGRRGKKGFLSILSVLVVNIWIACLLLYLLNGSFYKWLSILKIWSIEPLELRKPLAQSEPKKEFNTPEASEPSTLEKTNEIKRAVSSEKTCGN